MMISKPEINISKKQMEVINGALLGDGCLWKHKNKGNAQFCYLSSSKQHVEFLSLYFSDLIYSEGVKESTVYDRLFS